MNEELEPKPEIQSLSQEEAAVEKVAVDREMCQTAAICLAYSIYELDDEEKAVLLTKNGLNADDPKNILATQEGFVTVADLLNQEGKSIEEMKKVVLDSAKACPFNAIIVKDDQGKQIWPPE